MYRLVQRGNYQKELIQEFAPGTFACSLSDCSAVKINSTLYFYSVTSDDDVRVQFRYNIIPTNVIVSQKDNSGSTPISGMGAGGGGGEAY